MVMRRIGVLALQGAVSEHLRMAGSIGAQGVPVKSREDLAAVDALVIPGGESTAISRLIRRHELTEAIQGFAQTRPVLGTCAGLILCAREISGGGEYPHPLGLMDAVVERNGFGRQVDSFEIPLPVTGLGTVPAVFIRAPFIRTAGAGVQVLASLDGKIVMAKQGRVLVTAFHPELTDDSSIFRYFSGMIESAQSS